MPRGENSKEKTCLYSHTNRFLKPHIKRSLANERCRGWTRTTDAQVSPCRSTTELHDIKSRNRYQSRPYINNYQCICFDFSLTAIYPSIYIRHTCHCPIVTKHCCSAWGAFTALPARPVTLHSTAYQSPQLSHALPLVRLCIGLMVAAASPAVSE